MFTDTKEFVQTERKSGNVFSRQLHVCLVLSSSPAWRRIPSLRARARPLVRAIKPASARARGCPSSAVWSLWCVSDSASAARERDLLSERAGSWSDRYPPTGDLSFSFLISPVFPHSVPRTSAIFQRRRTFWFITGAFEILWRTFLTHWEFTDIWGSCGCAALERSGDGIVDNMPFFWDIAMQFSGSRLHHSHR